MLLHVAHRVEEHSDELGEADRATGDGDHGLAMARGFEAARARLETADPATAGEVLTTVGDAFVGSAGGAAGVVFGTLFREGAAATAGCEQLDTDAFRRFLAGALHGVERRGKATVGDKTLLDALAPALAAVEERGGATLDELLRAAAEAAAAGAERTRSMVARVGKARSLGERSLGHPDPGAVSLALILESMAEYASKA
jgi:dihydroxyacetone kinase-like protein